MYLCKRAHITKRAATLSHALMAVRHAGSRVWNAMRAARGGEIYNNPRNFVSRTVDKLFGREALANARLANAKLNAGAATAKAMGYETAHFLGRDLNIPGKLDNLGNLFTVARMPRAGQALRNGAYRLRRNSARNTQEVIDSLNNTNVWKDGASFADDIAGSAMAGVGELGTVAGAATGAAAGAAAGAATRFGANAARTANGIKSVANTAVNLAAGFPVIPAMRAGKRYASLAFGGGIQSPSKYGLVKPEPQLIGKAFQ